MSRKLDCTQGTPPVQRASSGRGHEELSDEQDGCRGWRVRGQGDRWGWPWSLVQG